MIQGPLHTPMKQLIAQRLKRVVTRETHDLILDTLTEDTDGEVEEALVEERQARAEALARAAAGRKSDAAHDSDTSAGTSPSAIDDLLDEEDCPVCSQILTAIRGMDEPDRTRGIAEYGEFRRAIEESEEAAVEVLENSSVLPDALNDVREVRP